MTKYGFAVIACPKCRQMQVTNLAHATKTCACGNKMHLAKAKLLVICDSADRARDALRTLATPGNADFVSAARIRCFSLVKETWKKDMD
ncbi:MAG: DUF1922 domain-containing protein [Methanocalculaceae archaeon]|jgi:hypothetical protein|nr:DUF1922 domain-containing protein [Methanocalculaceae archaeon]